MAVCHFPDSKVHDLKASKGLDSTDLRLLKMGCGTTSFAAVRNHTSATDTRPDEDTLSLPAATKSLWECRRVVDAIEILCAQKPRTYEGPGESCRCRMLPFILWTVIRCHQCGTTWMATMEFLIFARLRQCVVENTLYKLYQIIASVRFGIQTNQGYFMIFPTSRLLLTCWKWWKCACRTRWQRRVCLLSGSGDLRRFQNVWEMGNVSVM